MVLRRDDYRDIGRQFMAHTDPTSRCGGQLEHVEVPGEAIHLAGVALKTLGGFFEKWWTARGSSVAGSSGRRLISLRHGGCVSDLRFPVSR